MSTWRTAAGVSARTRTRHAVLAAQEVGRAPLRMRVREAVPVLRQRVLRLRNVQVGVGGWLGRDVTLTHRHVHTDTQARTRTHTIHAQTYTHTHIYTHTHAHTPIPRTHARTHAHAHTHVHALNA